MSKTTELTLGQVACQFDEWRGYKKPRDKIPESLWKSVQRLMETSQHKRTAILRTLGISGKQFKDKFGAALNSKSVVQKPKLSEPSAQKRFVHAPLDALSTASNGNTPVLSLQRPDGMKLSLSQPTSEQFSQLLNQFTR